MTLAWKWLVTSLFWHYTRIKWWVDGSPCKYYYTQGMINTNLLFGTTFESNSKDNILVKSYKQVVNPYHTEYNAEIVQVISPLHGIKKFVFSGCYFWPLEDIRNISKMCSISIFTGHCLN